MPQVEFHHHLLTEGYKAQLGSALLPCPIWKLHGNMTQAAALLLYFLCRLLCKYGLQTDTAGLPQQQRMLSLDTSPVVQALASCRAMCSTIC